MFTKDTTYLPMIYDPQCGSKKKFPLLFLVWYLFNTLSGSVNDRITATSDVIVSRYALSMATRPFLDLVMIHWIVEFSESHSEETISLSLLTNKQ